MSNAKTRYDIVIVGAGIAGALIAKEMVRAGKTVLLLEAGRNTSITPQGYQSFVEQYHKADAKTPNSPYPDNANAPSPSVLSIEKIGNVPSTSGYFVQKGPLPFSSNYTRQLGGTTLHWLGTCLRMTPRDFALKTHYGRGVDWPISYADLQSYYRKAEWAIGVSANVDEQRYHGITFKEDYAYPMQRIPPSYVDRELARAVDNSTVAVDGEHYAIKVVSTPQARNGMPNPLPVGWREYYSAADGQTTYRPVGAPGAGNMGERCEGNSSCIPICPVQAKYSALKTLQEVRKDIEIVTQGVASSINVAEDGKKVTGITYRVYEDTTGAEFSEQTASAEIYVVAAHAVETAKLCLNSRIGTANETVANSSGQMGRNLMDHPYMLTWGLAGQALGSFRGPGSTSGIPSLRDGEFRRQRAAFRIEIGNWGWNFAADAPYSTVDDLLRKNLFGIDLRRALHDHGQRQFRLGFLLEQLPTPSNRVTVDADYLDPLGIPRPVIHYDIDDYTRAGMQAAKSVSDQIFDRMGIQDCTSYKETDPGHLIFEDAGYTFHGSGHLVGTHRMGDDSKTSVVNEYQQTWDHDNLYLVGCGSMPTISTSNPTLTLAALSCKTAEYILRQLA